MLKRQDSLVSSARRQTPPPQSLHVIKSTGCMSGIIQLISKYQKKTKRLTSGIRSKQGKNNGSLSSQSNAVDVEREKEDDHLIKATRSPKIQPQNVKKEPTLVARLMGLEESSPPNRENNMKSTEIKRRKILHALEKCNDDLESIRKIINSLKRVRQIGDTAMRPPPSPLCNQFAKAIHNGRTGQRIKRPGAYEPVDKFRNNASLIHVKPVATTSCSKAMIQNVEEVCSDTEWGQKREAGRIGLMLQDHICRELIEEFVKEMDLISLRSLPFLACKKRLCF
ncbi:hypothetical protein P3S67_025809 [Capsicum chacoense]